MTITDYEEHETEFVFSIKADGCPENSLLARLALQGNGKMCARIWFPKGGNATLRIHMHKGKRTQAHDIIEVGSRDIW